MDCEPLKSVSRSAAKRSPSDREAVDFTAATQAGTIWSRREFFKSTSLAITGLAALSGSECFGAWATKYPMSVAELPAGNSPAPLPTPHFPNRLCAFVWRNWSLVPTDRLAKVVKATPAEIRQLGIRLGLGHPPRITEDQQLRAYITVIRRNWHLLPYEQLLELLAWTPEKMAFTLREDDFLLQKLGNLKPQCEPLRYAPPDEAVRDRLRRIADINEREFPKLNDAPPEPLFNFIPQLSAPPKSRHDAVPAGSAFSPRFCYSYFALYGDPLLEKAADPYPEGYLARLKEAGVNGVWLQGMLEKLAPFPWDPKASEHHEKRRHNLQALVARALRHGIRIYLYLNEPRAKPLAFFNNHPELKGVAMANQSATLCTSAPEVQTYLREAVAAICRAAPDLGGFFTITASENPTNCWSHHNGSRCPRCGQRPPAEVIAEVNSLFAEGIRQAKSNAQLIAWDWGWADDWAEGIIQRLPNDASLMSVSEWSIPIERGGIKSVIGEYSISEAGPGPRATRHWELARQRGLKTIAKIQASNTWELSAVPYIPALENVARHAVNLRQAKVDGLMLGWTLGGYPSPNLEVVAEIGKNAGITAEQALAVVAERRFGAPAAPAVVKAWRAFSAAFHEFPFHIRLLYQAPMQFGPANLLWPEPTRYASTMVGFPYDDLKGWRAVFPPEVFIGQFLKIAEGFETAIAELHQTFVTLPPGPEQNALAAELRVARAAAVHFRSTANQARFVLTRDALATAKSAAEAGPLKTILEKTLRTEIDLAKQLFDIQTHDSRIGFEASNQYFYVPLDLAEKVLNCRYLLEDWLPRQLA